MSIIVPLIFLAIAALAIGFTVWPVAIRKGDSLWRRMVGAAALALVLLGVALGAYLARGRPELANRAVQGQDTRDMNGLIAILAERMRARPTDVHGLTLLGQAYFSANDATDAARVWQLAIKESRKQGGPSAALLSLYGQSLVAMTGGAVPKEAETAFAEALTLNPKEEASRYYLGLASASHGDTGAARAYWTSLLAEASPDAPYRQDVVDRLAALTARSGAAAPNVEAMVQGLADRLKAQPDNIEGWEKLIRAYVVLGKMDRAKTALASARTAMAGKPQAMRLLSGEAKGLGLE